MAMIAAKLGVRNLLRNRWRSGLTLAAVAVAVGVMVWTLAFYEGWLSQMVQGATAVETVQVQVHRADYAEKPRVYETFVADSQLIRAVRSVADVVSIAPRVKAHGLLGNEDRSQVVRFLGVDPGLEAAATPVVNGLIAGRWLNETPPVYPEPREIVLGQGVAQQLRVDVGAELVAFMEAADGSLGNELFEVVGVVRTGNMQVDRLTGYVHIEDARVMLAMEGQVHELAIKTRDMTTARETAAAIATTAGLQVSADRSGDDGVAEALLVRPWQELLPTIDQMITLFKQSYWIMYFLVYIVAAVGILNTQRMSALERRREFGVMLAIGMRPRRMFRTIEIETVLLAIVGGIIGAAAGGLMAWRHATNGFDLTLFTDQATFSYMGVAFSERLFFVLTPVMVFQPVVIMLVVALLSGLLPAWKAARIDPAPTISGRT